VAEEKLILILANSIRERNRCVAGKELIPSRNGYKAGEWIRLADPRTEGAIKAETATCAGHGSVRPLDLVKVPVREQCSDLDHPEDWWIEPAKNWEYVRSYDPDILQRLEDKEPDLWSEGRTTDAVSFGYVRRMPKPSTLILMRAPPIMQVSFWKETGHDWNSPGQIKEKKHRRLWMKYEGRTHELSVTDPEFNSRHDLFNRMTTKPQELELANRTEIYLCLSLTPQFNDRHYKICATVFEPNA